MCNNKSTTGLCGHCALIICQDCINNSTSTPCHKTDNGRTVCSLHSKRFRLAEIDANRIVVSIGQIGSSHQSQYNKYTNEIKPEYPMFTSYYADFNV